MAREVSGPAEALGPSGRTPGAARTKRRGRWVLCWTVAVTLVLLVGSLTAKLFVWPAQNVAKGLHADAIVVLGGLGPRWQVALELAKEHAAPFMLVSVPSVQWNCPRDDLPGVQVECFRPNPDDTRGEARFAARTARANDWHTLLLVTSLPQATRARLRFKRCFSGTVYVVPARPDLGTWAYEVVYEWAALAKALTWQRGC